MRIDLHVHWIGTDPARGHLIHPSLRRGLFYRYLRRKFGLGGLDEGPEADGKILDRLEALAAGSGLDAVVLLPLDGIYDRETGRLDAGRTRVLFANAPLLEGVRGRPRLRAACSVNPLRRDALEELERCAAAGAVLVKWLPNSQGFDPADPQIRPFYRKLVDLGLPLLTHTGREHTIRAERQEYGRPSRLIPALEEGATVVCAHAGTRGFGFGGETFDDFARLAREWPNLYGDTSALTSLSRGWYIKRLEGLGEKLLHGSDYPIPPSPLLFAGRVPWKELKAIRQEKNPLALDVKLKLALGLPEETLTRAAGLFPSA